MVFPMRSRIEIGQQLCPQIERDGYGVDRSIRASTTRVVLANPKRRAPETILMHSTRHTPPPPRREFSGPAHSGLGESASLRYQQARDAYNAADYAAALHVLYPLLQERPLDISVNKLVGYTHFAREDYALAIAPLSAVSIFAPDDPEPMLICAQCLAKLGDVALARDLAIHALETSREDAAYAGIGVNAERFLATI